MLEAIVFDFDGVLVDSEPLHYQAFVLIARSLGLELTFEQYVQTYIGFDDRDAFRVMLEVTGREASEAAVAELCRKKQPAFDALAKATGELALPGSVELLDAAGAAGWKVAIASGATRADIDLMLGLLDRSDAFEAIVTADDVERSKPDPASYARAAAAIGVEPGRCLAIEDTRAGLISATTAGLRTLAITTSHEAGELAGDAERVIESLAGVTPEQLRAWYP
ncbi:MAG: HAD family phosphatase [Planctomycetota bacterium]